MNYIDFDGVILDTHYPLFKDHKEFTNNRGYINDTKYVQDRDWYQVLRESEIINDSINIIKTLDISNNAILTRVHSLENEGSNKVIYLRESGIKCPIILVPYNLKKTAIVPPKNNILIDDDLFNLDDWQSLGGIPIYFNKDDSDIDGWGYLNTKYPKTRTLKILEKMY